MLRSPKAKIFENMHINMHSVPELWELRKIFGSRVKKSDVTEMDSLSLGTSKPMWFKGQKM